MVTAVPQTQQRFVEASSGAPAGTASNHFITSFQDSGTVVVTADAGATVPDFLAIVSETYARPESHQGCLLLDCRALTIQFTPHDVDALGQVFGCGNRHCCAVALVMANSYYYKVGKIIAALGNAQGAYLSIFRDLHEAERWLAQINLC